MDKHERWQHFKNYTLPVALHYITSSLTLILSVVGLIESTGKLDTSLVVLLCCALVFGTVIFYAWAQNIEDTLSRRYVINTIKDNIENCDSLNLTEQEKEDLKLIVTKNL